MEYLKELERKFNEINNNLKEELSSFRTNRPTPKLIENINVLYMDQNMSLKQLGSISIEPPRDLVVSVWDKESIPTVAKAIESAGMGLNVSPQGTVIRVRTPELTAERRKELEKLIRASVEEARIRMRMERDSVNKMVNAEADKDARFRSKENLQKIVDKFNESIENMLKDKLNEIAN